MRVMKFGGTSLGVPDNFRRARDRVLREQAEGVVVVVSALSGVTNQLVEWCRSPAERPRLSREVAGRHRLHGTEVGVDPASLDALLGAWEAEGHVGALGDADRDHLLSYGERFAAALFAAALRGSGAEAAAVLAGDAGLVTDERFGAAHPLPEAGALVREKLGPLLARGVIPVVTGFLGRTRDGRTTTLGRGGSDFSASWIGAALEAEEIQIWTDTSGMLSADPRIVPEARVVPRLSFAEASELAYFGAKVLHPKTLLPAIDRNIPVRILNTAQPADAGSVIVPEPEPPGPAGWQVKSIACKKGVTAITIVSTRMLFAYGFLARVFEVFGRHHVVVDLVTTSEVSISVTVDDDARLERAIADLEGIGRIEVRRGLAVVAVVGEGAPQKIGLAGHLFTLLGGVGVGVEMISQGASRVNLSFVVREEDADRSVRLLHRGLGLDAEPAATAALGAWTS